MITKTNGQDGQGGAGGTHRFGKGTADGSAEYYGSPDNTAGESQGNDTVGPSSEGSRRKREGPEEGPLREARPLAPSATVVPSLGGAQPQQPQAPDDHAKPLEGIAWVEKNVIDKLALSGPQDFKALIQAVPVRARNLGFALSRLRKSNKVVIVGTNQRVTPAGIKHDPRYALAGDAGAPPTPLQLDPSENLLSQKIRDALKEHGPITRDELCAHLEVGRARLDRPLAWLREQALIGAQPHVIVARNGKMKDVALYYLQSPKFGGGVAEAAAVAPDETTSAEAPDTPILDAIETSPAAGGVTEAAGIATPWVGAEDDDCAACDSAGPGRGTCARHANKKPPSKRSRSRS